MRNMKYIFIVLINFVALISSPAVLAIDLQFNYSSDRHLEIALRTQEISTEEIEKLIQNIVHENKEEVIDFILSRRGFSLHTSTGIKYQNIKSKDYLSLVYDDIFNEYILNEIRKNKITIFHFYTRPSYEDAVAISINRKIIFSISTEEITLRNESATSPSFLCNNLSQSILIKNVCLNEKLIKKDQELKSVLEELDHLRKEKSFLNYPLRTTKEILLNTNPDEAGIDNFYTAIINRTNEQLTSLKSKQKNARLSQSLSLDGSYNLEGFIDGCYVYSDSSYDFQMLFNDLSLKINNNNIEISNIPEKIVSFDDAEFYELNEKNIKSSFEFEQIKILGAYCSCGSGGGHELPRKVVHVYKINNSLLGLFDFLMVAINSDGSKELSLLPEEDGDNCYGNLYRLKTIKQGASHTPKK